MHLQTIDNDAKTATEVSRLDDLRIDRRRQRADQLTAAILRVIIPYLADETGDERRDAHYALLELLYKAGAEVITDADRATVGLPPRDGMGYTGDELRAMEAFRLNLLMRPMTFTTQSAPAST